MKFILEISEEEYGQLKAGVLGESAPTMDFELSQDLIEGWESGIYSANAFIRSRLSPEVRITAHRPGGPSFISVV